MTEKRFIYCEEENGEFPFPYIEYDSKKVISLYECVDLLNELSDENEQLKTTISRLIEQNRKNNDLLVSDIRLLEKALWCPNCTINIKRLRELKKEFEK